MLSIRRKTFAVAGAVLAASLVLAALTITLTRIFAPGDAGDAAALLDTNLVTLEVTTTDFAPHRRSVRGGATTTLDARRALVISGAGRISIYDVASTQITPTAMSGPYSGREHVVRLEDELGVRIREDRIRHLDVAYLQRPGSSLLIASHLFVDGEKACFRMRLSTLAVPDTPDGLAAFSAEPQDWRSVFSSQPCVAVKDRGYPTALHQAGGRFVLLDDTHVLLTVGDFEHDGFNSHAPWPQMRDVDYGKVHRIDVDTGQSRIYSLGHRNNQGIARDAQGRIWATEHGPQGGDELNLIVDGGDYGWPAESYGVHYGAKNWPLSATPGRQDGEGYRRPHYAWVPSYGLSNLAVIDGFHPAWDGDLMVGSMSGRTLFRVHVRQDRVIVVEPIPMGARIRHVHQHASGALLLWTDREKLIRLRPGVDVRAARLVQARAALSPAAEVIFAQCMECHAAGGAGAVAPSLAGIVGRRVAQSGFEGYSDALSRVGGRWTRDRLRAYLMDPQEFAPGGAMVDLGLNDDPQALEDILTLLDAYE